MTDASPLSTSPSLGYHAMRTDLAAVRLPREVIRVAGPDAGSYLQGQLSQDVDSVGKTGPAWSFLLQPTGKVVAWLRVTRHGDEEIVLDVDAGFGQDVVDRLQRFLIRTKATIELFEGWSMVSVKGPAIGATDFASANAELILPADWPGLPGVDLLGPDVQLPAGVPEVDTSVLEAIRIECGVPAMGAELTDKTIPGEAGAWLIDTSVSFTKGCYTGQELVARIDSRGNNVPRNLRGIVIDDRDDVPVGASISVAGADVGSLTSAIASPSGTGTLALGYVARSVDAAATAEVSWDGGRVAARIELLPLVG